VSGHEPTSGRRQCEELGSGVSDAKDGTPRTDNEGTPATTTPSTNVLQEIASALGGLDHVASWLYWERRGSASWSPMDGISDEQRALVLKALERVEKARRTPPP